MNYIEATDKTLGEVCNESRQQFTRWRNGTRSPSFVKAIQIEDILGLPFECFIAREPNLEQIQEHLQIILHNLKDESKISISNNEVAKLFEISHITVSRWKSGLRSPKFDEAQSIEQKLQIPFELFMSSKPDIEAIEQKLKAQIKAVKKLVKEMAEN